MKKVLCFILTFIMFATAVFAEVSGEIGYSESAKNVYIAGDLSRAEVTSGKTVTLMLTDKTTGDVKYVDQLTVDENKKYETKFKFAEDMSNCELSVKEGDNDVNASVTVASVSQPTIYSLTLRDENGSHVIEADEFIKATAKITNKYGNDGKYKVLATFYGENNELLSCQQLTDGTFTFYDMEKQVSGISTVTVPQEAKTIKAFMWSDTQSIIPLSQPQVRTADDKKFGGDTEQITVAFIGDSITHNAHHLKGIEHYYHTRYPQKDIVFMNKGISGDTALKVLGRFDWDLTNDMISGEIDEAAIMIGMNDVSVGKYSEDSTYTDAQKDTSIQACVDNVEKIINKCMEAGISLTIITPSAFDDTEGFTEATRENAPEVNTYGLRKISEKLTVLAEEYDIPLVDLWTPTTEFTNYARSVYGETGAIIAGNDRCHPGEQGGTYMAYQFIKQQDGNPIIAKVEIDAENGTKTAENADVNLTSVGDSKIVYEYLPKAIPFAYTTYYQALEGWDATITEDINQEIIKITGLSEGTYSIKIGENTLTKTYTALELADGINIAVDENNPAQIQSKAAYEKAKIKVTNESQYRNSAFSEQYIMAHPEVDISKFDENSTNEELAVFGTTLCQPYRDYFSTSSSNYASRYYKAENWAKLRTQEQEARDAAKPVQRTVVIEKVQ